MSVQEVEEKFLSLAAPMLGDSKVRSVIGEVQALADGESLSELLALLRVSALTLFYSQLVVDFPL